jgi:hypothetical protein
LFGLSEIVMAGLDPAIPLNMARPCHIIGIAGSSPAMTARERNVSQHAPGSDTADFCDCVTTRRWNDELRHSAPHIANQSILLKW